MALTSQEYAEIETECEHEQRHLLAKEIASRLRAYDSLKLSTYRTEMLVNVYNWATQPNVLRTDDEHRVFRLLAKCCMRRLAFYSFWHETESGMLAIGTER